MFPKFEDKTLTNEPRARGDAEISARRTRRRSMLATLGIVVGVAASFVAGLGGSANAQQGLQMKIQIASQAYQSYKRTPSFVRARTTTRGAARRVVRSRR